ncbi:hypothetical protein FQR65_LT20020 [Abscondita terminalis]|nr:hypothetical protein FQR65_LT20020 [Abscondita terminalis]
MDATGLFFMADATTRLKSGWLQAALCLQKLFCLNFKFYNHGNASFIFSIQKIVVTNPCRIFVGQYVKFHEENRSAKKPDNNSQEQQAPAENAPTTNPAVENPEQTTQTAAPNQTATQQQPATQTAQTSATPTNSNNTSDPIALEKAAYTVALDAYKKGGAKQAIAPMQNFIKNYPNSIYTGNAYFWLAEFQLAIDPPNYNEAKKNYEIVAAKFPNSSKAPRALYQLYSIAKDVNKNTQTANVYKSKLLSTYPKSEEAGYFKKG